MRITIFGTGYVGLVTGACLADVGNHVVCVDIDAARVERLDAGDVPIYEPGLEEMVREGRRSGRLRFTSDAAAGVAHGDILFIAVGTPPLDDGGADLTQVLSVARAIGMSLERHALVVDKSTVPVGTADRVRETVAAALSERGVEVPFDVIANPEFLKEGAAVKDFMRPDRIIIGAASEQAFVRMRALYAPFNRNHDRIVEMDVRSAELTKYAANAMLATKISFMNEMANIAERVGADVEKVRIGIGSDSRIGFSFIYAGAGYGGSCFPKDIRALEHTARTHGYEPRILGSVDAVNVAQKERLFRMIHRFFDGRLADRTVAVWGLSFKPNTDDMREAPSRVLLERLWEAGARVRAYDPEARQEAARIYGAREDLALCDSAYAALEDADVLAVVTEWREFWSPDFDAVATALRARAIFDGRNIYDPATVEAAGIAYFGVGRGRSVVTS
jgi:UDPglucose 6-dehydrogenase